MSKQAITEEMKLHEQWFEEAREMTLDKLPTFISHLLNDYNHDYGTICHAITAGAVATAWAMNNTPQGGITGFQAGCIMWGIIRQWNYRYNKTGLKIIDYDNFLYPQYYDKFQRTINPDTWANIQRQAQAEIDAVDINYAEYLIKQKQYKADIAEFVKKYPDYYERKAHYDHLVCGGTKEWDEYYAKKESGFEFAPQKPYCGTNSESPVYKHWKSIVDGIVPFRYVVKKD